jgi:hypothetical protein
MRLSVSPGAHPRTVIGAGAIVRGDPAVVVGQR